MMSSGDHVEGHGVLKRGDDDLVLIRPAVLTDLEALVDLEESCFTTDKLSRRSFRRWFTSENCVFLVADYGPDLLGYGLVLLHKGTHLARLYSLAVSTAARGRGIGQRLITGLEEEAMKKDRFYMRLEVAETNTAAIRLYEKLGYRAFGEYENYYEDHADALRMQKRIYKITPSAPYANLPWYQQTTRFTCGPASLMMAMAGLDPNNLPKRETEMDIWREATTIFMTSGHGGCHPFGLALAAGQRGFKAKVFVNKRGPLFVDGVRSEDKKEVLRLVHRQFLERTKEEGVSVVYKDLTQEDIRKALKKGEMVVILISTYRLDGRKVPHWVTVTGIDEKCLYVHDPDPDMEHQGPVDCQHIPIAREDFGKMSSYGSDRLRSAVILGAKK